MKPGQNETQNGNRYFAEAFLAQRLDGKIALVTGAADGIGKATVECFVAEGARVVANDLPGSAIDQSLAHLENVHIHKQDVTDETAPAALAQAAEEVFGGLDILFNNAGTAAGAPVENLSDDLWNKVVSIDLTSVMRITRSCLPLLKKSTAGRIISTGSVMSSFSAPGMAAYTASKHGVLGLTRTFAMEFGQFGITANCIQPGAIVTGITREVFAADPSFSEYWKNKAPLGRLGHPEDIAKAALFLASDDAAFVSGIGMLVDGGAMQGA